MKKLITTNTGGLPLTLDRIRWMEDGINEAILAVCRSLLPPGATSMILEGCEINETGQGVFTLSAGWLYLVQESQEKICKVDAQTFNYQGGSVPFPVTGTTPRWNSHYEATAASVTFFDGTSKQIERVSKAYVVVDDDGTLTPISSVPNKVGLWVQGQHLMFRLQNGLVQVKGSYFRLSQFDELSEVLPVSMRPDSEQRIPIQAYFQDSNTNYTCALKIEANTGIVSIIDPINQGAPDVAYFITFAIPI